MFKKENLMTTSFIFLIALLIGAAVYGAFFKKEEAVPTLKTTTDMSFALEEQPILGKADAPVTLTLFYDYNCSHCGKWEQEIFPALEKDVLSTGLVNLRFANYPFMNITSMYAAMAAEMVHAKKSEAFLDFHHDVFSNQLAISLDSLSEKVHKHVPEISAEKAKADILNQTYIDHVLADKNHASTKQVSSTPSLFVGDVKVENSFDLKMIEDLINEQLKAAEGAKTDEVPEKE